MSHRRPPRARGPACETLAPAGGSAAFWHTGLGTERPSAAAAVMRAAKRSWDGAMKHRDPCPKWMPTPRRVIGEARGLSANRRHRRHPTSYPPAHAFVSRAAFRLCRPALRFTPAGAFNWQSGAWVTLMKNPEKPRQFVAASADLLLAAPAKPRPHALRNALRRAICSRLAPCSRWASFQCPPRRQPYLPEHTRTMVLPSSPRSAVLLAEQPHEV